MASGYQQDSNQLTPGFYRVVLTMTNTSYYPNANATTTYNGSVNPYDWNAPAYTNAKSMSATQATYMAQGNVRWNNILNALDGIADCRIENVVVGGNTSGADATTQPTSVAFTAVFDRDTFITGEWNKYLASLSGATANGTYTNSDGSTGTAYNGVGGSAVSSTAVALQDIITNAINQTASRSYRVYNPATASDSQVKVSVAGTGATAANIFGTIAVTQVSGTTLSGTPV
jgi:hypothetical protein